MIEIVKLLGWTYVSTVAAEVLLLYSAKLLYDLIYPSVRPLKSEWDKRDNLGIMDVVILILFLFLRFKQSL